MLTKDHRYLWGFKVGASAIYFSLLLQTALWLFSFLPRALKHFHWKAMFTEETWVLVLTQHRAMGGGRLHSHRLAQVSLQTQLMLWKAVLVTPCAGHLPRGHDLSVWLGPSFPDVLDPVWNTHARNPGKQQPFQKSNSNLVVRWEPSVGSHHPSQSHLSY